ncbi:hypothetical protein GIB67_018686 [Kingdonia uniflora]|uniref:Nuclear pore complex protein n=1 Tax=Kingdonia uniflora TaxID=39325 RepID=A0A7J7L244_9MAGN|nr:hypothetical protein GIB67_018686 [Kingdonia uniflora]
MVVDMETSPSYFDPEDLNSREPYRRYRERRSGSSISPLPGNSASKVFYDGQRIQRRPNTALFLEEIKQEFENAEVDAGMVSNKRSSIDDDDGFDSNRRDAVNPVLKSCKVEDEVAVDGVESTFALFASLLDSAIQGLMPIPDLILRFESACRNVSESIRNTKDPRVDLSKKSCGSVVNLTAGLETATADGGTAAPKKSSSELRFRVRKRRLWSSMLKSKSRYMNFYLKLSVNSLTGNVELPQDLILSPTTSHLEACQFVMTDHTAQLCLRIIQWLEGLASKALNSEYKVRGSYIGSHLPISGVWHHTQRYLKKGHADLSIVQHLDFDAPTREIAQQHPDDKNKSWVTPDNGRLKSRALLRQADPHRRAKRC